MHAERTKAVISFSGGVCSFWAAHRAIEKYGRENCTLLFADTKMEDEDLYRFNADAERVLGIPITVIADGRTPWEVFEEENMMGSSRVDLCSRILKRELLDRWRKKHADPATYVLVVGLDWTEKHRHDRLQARIPDWGVESPMLEWPYLGKHEMCEALEKIGIKVPRLYGMGFPHNNCGGFCVKAGHAHFAHLLKTMPTRFAFHERKEQEMRARLGKDISIMKDRKGGKTKPLTLRALRLRVQQGKEYDTEEWGGCGCAIDVPLHATAPP